MKLNKILLFLPVTIIKMYLIQFEHISIKHNSLISIILNKNIRLKDFYNKIKLTIRVKYMMSTFLDKKYTKNYRQ